MKNASEGARMRSKDDEWRKSKYKGAEEVPEDVK